MASETDDNRPSQQPSTGADLCPRNKELDVRDTWEGGVAGMGMRWKEQSLQTQGNKTLLASARSAGTHWECLIRALLRVDFVVLLFFIEARFLCADSHSNACNSSESQGRNSELHPGV